MSKKGLATAVLAASAAGAAGFGWLAARGGFAAGLLAHGFLAATVGGLADWFAVTAIFRKPLGISYRTEILKRNRPRITRALVEFAGSDILSRENIMQSLETQDFARMLADYLTERGGGEKLCALLDLILVRAVESFDVKAVARSLEAPVRRALLAVSFDGPAARGLSSFARPEARDGLLRAVTPAFRRVYGSAEIQETLLVHVAALRMAYVGDNWMRKAAFEKSGLSDRKLRERINEQVAAWFDELERGEGEAYARLSSWLGGLAGAEPARRLAEAIRRRQEDCVGEADIAGWIEARLESFRESRMEDWRRMAREAAKARILAFTRDGAAQASLNGWFLRFFDGLLAEHHGEILTMMDRQLARLSDGELVRLAETKVEDDLQMIRVNGALVGALAGMALFLLRAAAERMWA